MATGDFDKALYQAPVGIMAETEDMGPEIEIEIEIVGEDDKSDLDIAPEPLEFGANLVNQLDASVASSLVSDLSADYDDDMNSRKDWWDTYVKGLKLLGMEYEERTEPWSGACGVFHPILAESAVKFQSETIMETFPAQGPVRTKIIGKETPEKKEAAARVEADMNYELTEVMSEYRPDQERMLFSLCLSGNTFKKIYKDPSRGRQVSVFVPGEDIVVPYGASSIESAERVTHRMRKTKNEIRKLQVAGFYADIDMGDPVKTLDETEKRQAKDQGYSTTVNDGRFQLLEMHVDLDLKGFEDVDENGEKTGIELPYVVTFDKNSQKLLSVYRNWEEDDPKKLKRQHFVHYGYIPGFGFYCYGLIHLIGGHAHAATSLLRQLVDAGSLANLPGGFKTRGMRVKGDDTPIAPGEFRDVDIPSGALRDNMMPLPYKEPSQTLVALMDKIIMDAQRMAATADLKVSDMSTQAPVGTTLAVLERMLKVMSAVQARIYYSMKQEFKLLAGIIRDNTPDDYDYDPETGNRSAKKADYEYVDIIPVSDPNASTMSQRVVQFQAVHQLSQTAPQIYDQAYLHRQMIETLGVKNASKIVPIQEDMKPVDPVSENMAVLMGKPVKAFMHQDHQAHLGVHMAAMQDPKIAAIMGQNPQAQAIQAAAMAHVMEHIAFQYRRQIEEQLGASLPPMPEKDGEHTLPDEVEVQLSQLAAMAAAKLLQKNMGEAQQQQAQQQAQDPLIQMQQKELELKEKDLMRKVTKDQMDAAAKADEIRIKDEALQQKGQLEGTKIGVNVAQKQAEMQHQGHTEGTRMGIDIGKHKSQLEETRRMNAEKSASEIFKRDEKPAKPKEK